MSSEKLTFLRAHGEAKHWFQLVIIRNILLGGFLAATLTGLATENLLVLSFGFLAIPSEIITSRRISHQLNLISKRARENLTSRAVALRFEIGSREEIESLAQSIKKIPTLEKYLSERVSSRICVLTITPILTFALLGNVFLVAEGVPPITLALSLLLLLIMQTLGWIISSKEELELHQFFPGSLQENSSNTAEDSEEESGEEQSEGRLGRIGRVKELRWTDCRLVEGESSSAFRWGLAPAGRITGVITSSLELRKAFVDSLIDPWALDIGRVFIDTNRETYRVDHLHRDQWQNEVGLISGRPRFAPLTVEGNLKAIRPRATRERLLTLLKDVGLEAELMPEGLATKVESDQSLFTPSLRRRLALARVLLKDSSIVVLDLSGPDSDEATEDLLIRHMRDMATAGKIVILLSERPIDTTLAKKQIDLDALAPTLVPQVSV
jgi:ABC-type transport system involved in cytochrome bd biosynthesis fused ATPase/permease subunit